MREHVALFYSKHSPLSNHYPAPFQLNGTLYNCSEQYIMQQKCLHFGDHELADKIMNVTDPVEQKNLGKNIKNFDKKSWIKNAKRLIFDGIKQKVIQNLVVSNLLLHTDSRKIAEANPNDAVFGIGASLNDEKAWDIKAWSNTKNVMGKILEKIRSELKFGAVGHDHDSSTSSNDN